MKIGNTVKLSFLPMEEILEKLVCEVKWKEFLKEVGRGVMGEIFKEEITVLRLCTSEGTAING